MKGSFLAVALVSMLVVASLASDVEIARLELMPEQACTVLFVSDGESSFGGNNEDYMNPLTKVWFIPREDGAYGRVYFGFEDLHAQGGMNDQGLFFDGLGIDELCMVDTTSKEEYFGNLVDKILRECATVDCAIGQFEQYYSSEFWFWQFMFGDATGVSAIIESDAILRQEGGHQVATNFLQSTTSHQQAMQTDWRYREAMNLFQIADSASADVVRGVLDAVHASGDVNTLYSNVYDLTEQIVYLYFFHDFEQVIALDLETELEQGFRVLDIASFFPSNATAEAWSEPKLAQRTVLIESIIDSDVVEDDLRVYAGEYEMLEGWGDPADSLEIIAGDRSLFLRFPWHRQFELHPVSRTEFAYVGFARSEYAVMMNVRFGFNSNGETEYLELVMGEQATRSVKR